MNTNITLLETILPYTAISPFLSQCFWTVYLPDARGVSVHMDLLREEELPVSFPHECQKSAHNPTVCTGCPVLFIRGTKRHRRWRKQSLCHLCSGISTVFIKEQRGKLWGEKSSSKDKEDMRWGCFLSMSNKVFPSLRAGRSEQEPFLQTVRESFVSDMVRSTQRWQEGFFVFCYVYLSPKVTTLSLETAFTSSD